MNITKRFQASSESYNRYNGPVEIVRPLTHLEADLDETGPMYRVRHPTGYEFDVFADELY